jgi:hypothetical protein
MNGISPPFAFSLDTWIAMFPEFTQITQPYGQAYWNNATLICANSCTNPAAGDGNLQALLYWLTSHFAWLQSARDANGNPVVAGTAGAQAPSPLVGRISDATEGSVSVATEWNASDPSALENFLTQTKYGAAYWAMTSQYRTARYLARPTIVQNVPFGFFHGRF